MTRPASASSPTSSRRLRPDDAVLSEEGLEDPRRFDVDRVWIIDPLDGTREYGEPGRHDWAVHVALWDRRPLRRRAPSSLPALGSSFADRPAAGRCPASSATGRGSSRRATAPRTRRSSSPTRSTRRRAPRLGRRQGDGGRHRRDRHLRPRRRHVPVGLGRAGRRRRWPPACTSAASTARRSSTTTAIRGCPTSSCAARVRDAGARPRCGLTSTALMDLRWSLRPEMELKATRFEIDGRVATVWLHRPHRHNAWTGRMHAEYRWILAQLEADRSGAGRRGHRHAAGVLRRRRHATRSPATPSAAAYDDGLPGRAGRPGLRRAPRVRPRLRVPVRATAPRSSPP